MDELAPVFEIATLAQVKALADPLRIRILRELAKRPMSAMQLAKLLQEKTTRLYHHMESLEASGLIVIVETRQTRGFVQKFYRSIAADFAIDSNLLRLTEDLQELKVNHQALLLSAFESSLAEMREAANARLLYRESGPKAFLYRRRFNQSDSVSAEVGSYLEAWFASLAASTDERQEFAITVAIHPISSEPEVDSSIQAAK